MNSEHTMDICRLFKFGCCLVAVKCIEIKKNALLNEAEHRPTETSTDPNGLIDTTFFKLFLSSEKTYD